jgi:predicted HAD superfamily Cof-like phosphohydrolase
MTERDMVERVVHFNKEVLHISQRSPAPLSDNEHKITMKCLLEEVDEYEEAYFMCMRDDEALKHDVEAQHLSHMIDAMIDNIYFAIGAMYKMGLTEDQIRRCFNAVDDCNVQKKLGKNAKRDTGAADAVKPEGWIGPEQKILKIILERTNENDSN